MNDITLGDELVVNVLIARCISSTDGLNNVYSTGTTVDAGGT